MLIFLDFDGVVHPLGESDFSRVKFLSDLVECCPFVRFVFSTSWREFHSFNLLKSYMPPDVAKRCIGVTPFLGYGKHSREKEIKQYLKEHNYENTPYIAIDDNDYLFNDLTHVVVITGGKGLDEGWVECIVEKIKGMLKTE